MYCSVQEMNRTVHKTNHTVHKPYRVKSVQDNLCKTPSTVTTKKAFSIVYSAVLKCATSIYGLFAQSHSMNTEMEIITDQISSIFCLIFYARLNNEYT